MPRPVVKRVPSCVAVLLILLCPPLMAQQRVISNQNIPSGFDPTLNQPSGRTASEKAGSIQPAEPIATPTDPAAMVELSSHVPPQIAAGHAVLTGHYPPNKMIRLAIPLNHPNQAGEDALLRELQDPKSPNFHKFLTAEEWNKRFAPSAADEQSVVDWAKSQGLAITNRYANRLLVDVEAPASLVEKAFNVTINSYKYHNEVDYSNDRNPTIPSNISGIIGGVLGLNNIQRLHASKGKWDQKPGDYSAGPAFVEGGSAKGDGMRPSTNATGGPVSNLTNGNMDPSDIYSSQTYNYYGLWQLGHCCNPAHLSTGTPPETSIAIAAWGDFSSTDYAAFASQYGLAYNYNYYYIDGQPSGGPNGETMLDSEWTTATANSFGSWSDTSHIYVYMAGSWSQATNSDVFNTMLSNGYARVFTTSWSCTEDTGCSSTAINAWHGIFGSMLAQGWTLMTASGDRGSTDDCYFNNPAHTSVAYPASDPYVLAVGGTSLTLNGDGTFSSESGWQGGTSTNSCYYNNGGSGGGQSVHFSRPSYQDHYSSATGRLVPDVSLNAWGATIQNYYFGGSLSGTGGTSIASPEMAGFFAQENAYLLSIGSICGGSYNAACGPYGQPHYAIFDEGLNNRSMHYPFYDITTGCNSNDQTSAHSLTYYCAGTSYDLVTGWGPSNMMQLAWSLNWERLASVANGAPYLTWSGPSTSQWYNSNQTVSWQVNDYKGNEGPNGTGVAGFWQAWDYAPSDPTSESHGGSGNLFYAGPTYANATNGCLSLVDGANGCAGGVGQGCHYAYAIGWNNEGWTTAYGGQSYYYGPVCYDTIPPVSTSSVSGTKSGGIYVSPAQFTLHASDYSPGSGVWYTAYQINGGGYYSYSSPFTISANGVYNVNFYSADNAGNYETAKLFKLTIARWIAQTSGTSANLRAISCTTSVKCEVVGSGGTILRTINSGATWTAQTSGTTAILNGVSCSGGFCVAVGNGGVLLITTNSGSTWIPKSSGTTQNLLSASCTSTTVCVVVGGGGKILKTVNGGGLWTLQTSGTANNLNSVSCSSTTVCEAAGANGTIRATTNGGTTWTGQTSGTSNALISTHCASTSFCVAVGSAGTILTTSNGGGTWTPHTSGTSQNLNSVNCVSATICRAVGNAGTITSTTNGGGTWSAQPTSTSSNLFGVSTWSVTSAYAVGSTGAILNQ